MPDAGSRSPQDLSGRSGAGTPAGCGRIHRARCARPIRGGSRRRIRAPGSALKSSSEASGTVPEHGVDLGRGDRKPAEPPDQVDVAVGVQRVRRRCAVSRCAATGIGRRPGGSRPGCRQTNDSISRSCAPTRSQTRVPCRRSPGRVTREGVVALARHRHVLELGQCAQRPPSAVLTGSARPAASTRAAPERPAGADAASRWSAVSPRRTGQRAGGRRRRAPRRAGSSTTAASGRPRRRGRARPPGRPTPRRPPQPAARRPRRPPPGYSAACASNATSPNDSLWLGTATTSAARNATASSSARIGGRKSTAARTPSALASPPSRWTACPSAPDEPPTTRSRHGRSGWRRISTASARTSTSGAFEGLDPAGEHDHQLVRSEADGSSRGGTVAGGEQVGVNAGGHHVDRQRIRAVELGELAGLGSGIGDQPVGLGDHLVLPDQPAARFGLVGIGESGVLHLGQRVSGMHQRDPHRSRTR